MDQELPGYAMPGAPHVLQRLVTPITGLLPVGGSRGLPTAELQPRLPIMPERSQTPVAQEPQIVAPFTAAIAGADKVGRLGLPPRRSQ